MAEVLTLGEAMAAIRASGPVRLGGPVNLSVAGAELNVAIGLARLGHAVDWLGVVGDDELGALLLRTLRAEGVGTGYSRVEQIRPTGLVLFEPRVSSITRVWYSREGSAGSCLSPADVERAMGTAAPKVVHVTGITPALGADPRAAVEAAVDRAAQHGAVVSFDVNFRRNLWDERAAGATLTELLGAVDVIFASDDELGIVAPGCSDPVRFLQEEHGVREVVVKHGAGGATSHGAEGQCFEPAVRVDAVDTIGAGDAFVAGYLSGLLDGVAADERLRRGTGAGAFAVATHGDWEGLPTRADLRLLRLEAGGALR